MISLADERNYRHYRTAQARDLRVESRGGGKYLVSSFSNPAEWHEVFVCESGYACDCPSRVGCSHGCLASALEYPEVLTGWLLADCQRIREEWRRKDDEARRSHLPRGKKLERIKADIRKSDAVAAEVWPQISFQVIGQDASPRPAQGR